MQEQPLRELPLITEKNVPVLGFWRFDLPGPALYCCGKWHPIAQIPLRTSCCDRVFFWSQETAKKKELRDV